MAYLEDTTIKFTYKGEEKEVTVFRIESDVNGNPRYGVHYLQLDLKDYYANKCTRLAGFYLYRGKKFGGVYTLSSYGLQIDIPKMYARLHDCLSTYRGRNQ